MIVIFALVKDLTSYFFVEIYNIIASFVKSSPNAIVKFTFYAVRKRFHTEYLPLATSSAYFGTQKGVPAIPGTPFRDTVFSASEASHPPDPEEP